MSGTYNGFPGWFRKQQARKAARLRATGDPRMEHNANCDVCGVDRRVKLSGHSEDYGDLLDFKTLCGGCHAALHLRFRDWGRWVERFELAAQRGWKPLEWAVGLGRDPVNLAADSEAFLEALAERQPAASLF